MTLSKFKHAFLEKLIPLYGTNEVQSLFRLLIDYYLSLRPVDLVLQKDKELTEVEYEQLDNALERLLKEEPIQYIIGQTEFYGLSFKVCSDVLIPRPETEELVTWVLSCVDVAKPLTILDIGTGSGCVAISLAKQLPQARVYAMDVSPKALVVAKENARINNVAVTFIEQDILATVALSKEVDIIVSNPPYVRELEKAEMQKNVLDNEPALALYVSDADPLIFYQKITVLATEHLSPNGMLFFEINQYLGNEMEKLLIEEGLNKVKLKKDLFGVDRMIKGVKKRS